VYSGQIGALFAEPRAHAREFSHLLQDVGAAMENLLPAASVSGLGAYWLGAHPREDRVRHIAGLFSLPKNVFPVSVVAVGQAAETPPARTRYRGDAVHEDAW
jgi:nitroreductase